MFSDCHQPFNVQYCHHKETSQLIYKAKSVDWFLYDVILNAKNLP